MTQELSDRAQLVLEAVIASYIATAEPVGSRTVSKLEQVDLSPATIRNVMADLEDAGLLAQPHVSAGRIPTPRGLRFYVDSLLTVEELDRAVKNKIKKLLSHEEFLDTEQILQTASRVLSGFSRHAGIVAAPSPEQELFRQVEFINLKPGLILVVLVSQGGQVQNRMVHWEQDLAQEELDKYSRYLTDLLSNLSLTQVRGRLAEEMALAKTSFDEVLRNALHLGSLAFTGEPRGALYIDGRTNLLNAPEFSDLSLLRQIFQTFEEKSTLLRLLEKSMSAEGVQIFIGMESDLSDLEGVTAVTSSYGPNSRPVGALAVIGPTRMDYSRIIPVVDFTARLISRVLGFTP